MSEKNVNENIKFYQGTDDLSKSNNEETLKLIKQKVFDLSNMKNIHFLFGSGTSTGTKELPAIPTMKDFILKIEAKLAEEQLSTFKKLKDNKNENLEDILGVLYSKRDYLLGVKEEDLTAIEPVLASNLVERPTIKISIYKNRRGRYKGIYLWCKADLGCCRIQPMFATGYDYEIINIDDTKIIIDEPSAF